MTISILGCGWYGLPLAKSLVERGHYVNGSTTHPAKFPNLRSLGIEPYLLDLYAQSLFDEATHRFFDCDALVVTVPPKNNPGYVGMIRELVGIVLAHNVPKLIYISSTGVYGEPNKKVDELSPTLPLTTNAKARLDAENAFRDAPALNTICLRCAGLVGPGKSPAGFIKLTKRTPMVLHLLTLSTCKTALRYL